VTFDNAIQSVSQCVEFHFLLNKNCSFNYIQARSQDLTLGRGPTETPRVHFFLKKSLQPFFSRCPQNSHLLTPVHNTSHSYSLSLRPRAHDRELPDRLTHLTDCNFIIRMLFYQVYWHYFTLHIYIFVLVIVFTAFWQWINKRICYVMLCYDVMCVVWWVTWPTFRILGPPPFIGKGSSYKLEIWHKYWPWGALSTKIQK